MSGLDRTGPDSRRRALITGVSGQDGSYLAELLLEEGYEVYGLIHSGAAEGLGCAEHLHAHLGLVYGELLDAATLTRAVTDTRPHELYHLAAPSFVPDSWLTPPTTFAAIAVATAVLLQAVREHAPETRVFIASSSAMFGDARESPQREDTPFRPQSPYATSKLAAHQLAGQLRSHDGLFIAAGIMYNHESERRPESFVTRKITKAVAEIKLGARSKVTLGNLCAVRDWSYAGDIMRAAWLTLQQDEPGDYVLASGRAHTVGELAQIAFAHTGLDSQDHVEVDPALVRPPESAPLVGDPTLARQRLGWRATLDFEQLVRRMVDADLRALTPPVA